MHSSPFLSSLLNAVLDFRIRVIKNEKELGRGEAFVRGEKRGLFKKRGEGGISGPREHPRILVLPPVPFLLP